MVSLLTVTTVILYRGSAEHVRNQAADVRTELESTNAELSSVLKSRIASAQLMFKVLEIGDLIGWWYEPATKRIHFTASEKSDFRSFKLTEIEQEQRDLPLLVQRLWRNRVS